MARSKSEAARGRIGAGRREAIPTSVVLQQLHDGATDKDFTLDWLIGNLRKRSFGIIMLVLGMLALAPGASFVAGLLLMILALEMIGGWPAPIFPRRIATHPMPTRYFAVVVRRAVPVLRYLEKLIHPRWPTPLETTKRFVGIIVLMLTTILVLAPIPLSNIVPALAVILIALAYLEEDGLLLSVALLIAAVVLTVAFLAAWEAFVDTKWMLGISLGARNIRHARKHLKHTTLLTRRDLHRRCGEVKLRHPRFRPFRRR